MLMPMETDDALFHEERNSVGQPLDNKGPEEEEEERTNRIAAFCVDTNSSIHFHFGTRTSATCASKRARSESAMPLNTCSFSMPVKLDTVAPLAEVAVGAAIAERYELCAARDSAVKWMLDANHRLASARKGITVVT